MTDFETALGLVLKSEGGRVDDPKDPGGRTNQGVTQRVYDAFRDSVKQARRSVYLIGRDEISAIYRCQYWDTVRGDDLPAGVGYCVFDEAVNSGPVQAIKWLQAAAGVTADGHLGMLSLAAVKKAGPASLINAMCDARLGFMRKLPTWLHFAAGWTRRVADVRARSLSLSTAARAALR